MADLSYPYTITSGTRAVAEQVQGNFDAVGVFAEDELLHVDGSRPMEGPLTLVGDPTLDNHAANKSYVDNLVPVGTMWDFCGTSLPAEYEDDWALCDGSEQTTSDPKFERLFQLIGYTWGGAGGVFNLPDYRDKSPVGAGLAFAVGASGGQKDSIIPAHQHDIAHGHGNTFAVSNGTVAHQHNGPDHSHPMPHTHNTSGIFRNVGGTAGLGTNFTTYQPQFWAATDANATVTTSSLSTPNTSNGGTGQTTATTDTTHSHGLTGAVAALPTTNTPPIGEAVTGKNYHPYAACLKIVRL